MNALYDRLRRALSGLKDQLNARVVLGLVFLLLTASFLSGSRLADHIDRTQNELAAFERQIALRDAIAQQTDWGDRAASAQDLVDTVENRFWRGDTSGLVAAEIQTVLEQFSRRANLEQVRITVLGEGAPLHGSVQVFEAQLTARDLNGQFLLLFDLLANEGRAVRITRFEWDRPNARVIMTVEAPALVGMTSAALEEAAP